MADPAAFHTRTRLGGGACAGGVGARRRTRQSWPKLRSRPRICAGKTPTRSSGECELGHVLARVVRAAAAAWRRRGRTADGRRAAARCAALEEIKRGGGCFLTERGDLGGRHSGGEDNSDEDRRRRPSFNGGGGKLDWAHGKQ
jgi:hypothetical protein